MIGMVALDGFNLKPSVRNTIWTTRKAAAADGGYYPVATVLFAVYVDGQQSLLRIQFRGNNAVERLKQHFSSQGFNAIKLTGHLEPFKMVEEGEDPAKYGYSAAMAAIENGEELITTGTQTTVIVADNFDSIVGINPLRLKEQAVLSGLPSYATQVNPTFVGMVNVNTTIMSDGPKYQFGKSVNRADPEKVRFSVSGIARNGANMGKLRVEIHGKARVDIFESIVKRNNALFISGPLIAYNNSDGSTDFAVWVDQFQAVNLGMTESVNGEVVGRILSEGIETDLLAADGTPGAESLYTVYGPSSSGGNLFSSSTAMDDDIPF